MTISLGSTYATYSYMAKNSEKVLAQEAADPINARETAYYKANIEKVKTVDDFVNNYQLFNYAMKAYGLSDMAYAKAYMKKVLNSDVNSSTSFVNKLSDDKFKSFAKQFAYLKNGTLPYSTDITTVVNKFTQQTMEENAGADDQGVQLALYFKRNASTTTSAYSLLGDAALWQVMKTVYGFPDEMANADIATQKKAVDAKFNVKDLQDPEKVDKLLKRFTVMWDVQNNTSSDPVLQLFDTSNSYVSTGVSSSLLDLKYGG
ncbi:DUF1217 domain-containing protein [Azorhizobium sp. AG788]|uniref:DUF1217 domain-containing protein n=1 Tax=Azorhizobium sp. AG788 TaxID=2183897 RepID=UPI0031390209